MKQILLPFFLFFLCTGLFAQSNVTFTVDMNQVTSGFTTVYVSGTFNGWSGDANPLSDADNDGIWTVTLPIPNGNYEYKFSADNWNIQENLTAGSSCTVTNSGFTNRSLALTGDTDTGTVCWNACDPCSAAPTNSNVTFTVDMNQVTSGFTTVYISGTFNGWSGDANPLSDADNDGVWTVTLPIPDGTIEYKFSADNWNIQENLTAGSSCTVTNSGFTNRVLTIAGDVDTGTVCWDACTVCGAPPAVDGNITFSVDMNQVSTAFTTVYVSGTFNGWSGTSNPLSDADGDGIWEGTFLIPAGGIEFKYSMDDWASQEALTPGSACTTTSGGFTNRIMAVDGDQTLATNCFNECVMCSILPVELISFKGKAAGENVELAWETGSEINNKGFVIEKKTKAAREFSELAFVAGAGDSTYPATYSYTDRTSTAGVVYDYRLRQTDFDGVSTYSQVISVQTQNKNGLLSMFPNPTTSDVEFRLQNVGAGALLSISDISGAEVFRTPLSDVESQTINLSLGTWTKGLYIVHINSAKNMITKKLLLK